MSVCVDIDSALSHIELCVCLGVCVCSGKRSALSDIVFCLCVCVCVLYRMSIEAQWSVCLHWYSLCIESQWAMYFCVCVCAGIGCALRQ